MDRSGAFPGYRGAQAAAERATTHNNRGLFAHLAGRLSEAESEYRSALELHPENAAALSNYGFLLAQRGQHTEALSWYRRAIAAQPDYTLAHNNLGNSLLALEDHAGAVAAYSEALVHDPDHPLAQRNLAIALHASGDLAAAAVAYEAPLRHDPDNMELLYAAGVLHASIGELDRAATHLHRLLSLDALHAAGWSTLGFVCLARRDYGSAIEHCARAVELAPGNPRAHYNLALAHAAIGDLEAARHHRSEAVIAAPDFAEAQSALTSLQALAPQ